MAKIEGLKSLLAKLKKREAEAAHDAKVSVVVGFSSAGAIHVHENMEPKTLGMGVPRPSGLGVYWGPSNYGPKYLERPARELAPELGDMVRKAVQKKLTLTQGLLLAGLRLQRESQELVPVEYGVLKGSAFTEEEK